jgi:hypothetical protein
MQVCFVRGLSSPCSQAGHLAHKAPVSPMTLRNSREQARTHMKANGLELGSRKPWSCQACRRGLCHGPKLPDNKQDCLGIARQPATGQDMELHNSNSVMDESHAKFRRELCCTGRLKSRGCGSVFIPRAPSWLNSLLELSRS